MPDDAMTLMNQLARDPPAELPIVDGVALPANEVDPEFPVLEDAPAIAPAYLDILPAPTVPDLSISTTFQTLVEYSKKFLCIRRREGDVEDKSQRGRSKQGFHIPCVLR